MNISKSLTKKMDPIGLFKLEQCEENDPVDVIFKANDNSKQEILALGFTNHIVGEIYTAHTTAGELEKLAVISGVSHIEISRKLFPG